MEADLEFHGLVVVGEAHGQLPHARCPGQRPRHKAGQSGPLLKPANCALPRFDAWQPVWEPSCRLIYTRGVLASLA